MQLDSDINVKDDLGGAMSIKLNGNSTFNEFCATHIENYNPERLEILAMRVYYGQESFVTLYAMDKERMKADKNDSGKIPVKKFRLKIDFFKDFIPFIEECNFTLTTGEQPLAAMEVINV